MKYVDFKDIKLSHLGFGTMRLPKLSDDPKDIDQDLVNKMVDLAIASGVNYFDTAYVYHAGFSEVALGKALEKYDRSKYYIADKMSLWKIKEYSDMEREFNLQLKKLKTDYIDFYLVHCMDENTYPIAKKVDVFKFVKEKQKEGKIKYIGFSVHAKYEMFLEVLNEMDFDFVQIQYNYLDLNDNPGDLGYQELVKRNIPIMIMEPLKGGTLVNLPDYVTKPFKEIGKSNQEMAFRWLDSKPGIKVILSGMSNYEQMVDNINIFSNITPLTEAEFKRVDEVRTLIEENQKIKCTGCSYCMPCPTGINIPSTFKKYNKLHFYPNTVDDIDYESLTKCVNCQKCMNHCPQHLEIPSLLKQILNEK